MAIDSIAALVQEAERTALPLWEVILREDLKEGQGTREDSLRQMKRLWDAMKASGDAYRPQERSHSGLAGGDSAKVSAAMENGALYGGRFFQEVIVEALKVSECNACMKRIVAAPTAGSCGVLPAVLLPLLRRGEDEEALLRALYVAAGFGEVIASRASISGAEGGCQAEVGAASAMAAAALADLRGGSPAMCANACALALSRGVIFPTIHLQEPDPACDLDYVPNQARVARAEAAISVSLGFGGHNAAIALRRCV